MAYPFDDIVYEAANLPVRFDNRPQDAILPHNKIVAAREETRML
jgi:hypothetical protein